jgi:hypothetical protein
VLGALISRDDTPLGDEAKARILGQLDRACQRFEAINPAPDLADRPA